MKLYFIQIISTILLILIIPIARYVVKKITLKYSQHSSFKESRTRIMLKCLYISINVTAIVLLFVIWGVEPQNILISLSSIFAVIGVAMFAQWSILSNLTSGVIIFFTMHIKIGDRIKIYDKDFPIEAEIIDMKSFSMYLKTDNGEQIIYPNNLILQKGVSIILENDIKEGK